MAEKYGTIPKKFTKEWWSWFWMYYKWYVIGTVFALTLLTITIIDAVTAEKYDATVLYAGHRYYTTETQEKFEEILSPMIEDVDGNGKKSIYFSSLDVDTSSKDVEYLQARALKIDTSFTEKGTYLYIMDKELADLYKGEDAGEMVFAPLDDWLTADISGLATYDAHGKAYGVDISNLKFFKDAEIDTSGLYLFMRYYPRSDQRKSQLKGYNASIKLANEILSVQ